MASVPDAGKRYSRKPNVPSGDRDLLAGLLAEAIRAFCDRLRDTSRTARTTA
jgi:hypothetical protein